jgi:hypothetical protein
MFNFFQKTVIEQKGKALEDLRYKHMMVFMDNLKEKLEYKRKSTA